MQKSLLPYPQYCLHPAKKSGSPKWLATYRQNGSILHASGRTEAIYMLCRRHGFHSPTIQASCHSHFNHNFCTQWGLPAQSHLQNCLINNRLPLAFSQAQLVNFYSRSYVFVADNSKWFWMQQQCVLVNACVFVDMKFIQGLPRIKFNINKNKGAK